MMMHWTFLFITGIFCVAGYPFDGLQIDEPCYPQFRNCVLSYLLESGWIKNPPLSWSGNLTSSFTFDLNHNFFSEVFGMVGPISKCMPNISTDGCPVTNFRVQTFRLMNKLFFTNPELKKEYDRLVPCLNDRALQRRIGAIMRTTIFKLALKPPKDEQQRIFCSCLDDFITEFMEEILMKCGKKLFERKKTVEPFPLDAALIKIVTEWVGKECFYDLVDMIKEYYSNA